MVSAQRDLGGYTTVLFGHEQGKYPDGNSVLVRGLHRSVLIDPSLSMRSLEPPLEVHTVLLTHAHEDHAAGVSAVRWQHLRVHPSDLPALRSVQSLMELYGVPREVWPQMTEFVTERFHFEGWPEAEAITDGEVLDLGGVRITLLHAPGHTSGHSLYLVEGDDGVRVVVTGDIDLTGFGAYYGDAGSSLEDFERTLLMARDLEAHHYVTFHHKGVIDGHEAFAAAVDDYATSFQRREHALLALLEVPRTEEQLLAEGIVYRKGTRPQLFGDSVERRTIEQHLQRLVGRGAVELVDGEYRRT
jgi:glyoxylase-like metal-dependent hydrolase (beta-lactamase superfamily II)